MNTTIEKLLNEQIRHEAATSMTYLAMASWAECNGYNGVADFFYLHSEEERMHMTKIVRYINERNGVAIIPELKQPNNTYETLSQLFEAFLQSERTVTHQINAISHECLAQKDYNTHNFIQWYVSEQLEEESLAKTLLDKLAMIGNDTTGHYLFDRDIATIKSNKA